MGCSVSKPGFRQESQQMNFWPSNHAVGEVTVEEGGEGKRALSQESDGSEKGPLERAEAALSNANVAALAEEEEEDEEKKMDEQGTHLGYEVMPGSPSFRVYYSNPVEDSDDVVESTRIDATKRDRGTGNEKSISRMGEEYKLAKKEKGGRLWAMAKRHVIGYRCLNVRSSLLLPFTR